MEHRSIRRQPVTAFVSRNSRGNTHPEYRSSIQARKWFRVPSSMGRISSRSVFGGATSCQGLPEQMPSSSMNHVCQSEEKPTTIEATVCREGGFLRRVGVEENVFFHVSAMPGEMSAGPGVTE